MKKYVKRAIEIYQEMPDSTRSIAGATRQACKESGIEYQDNKRSLVSKYLNAAKNRGVFEECEKIGIDPEKINNYWYKGKHYSINVKGDKNEFNYDEFKKDLIDEISKWSPSYPKIFRSDDIEEPHCMVFSPADIHIGKLCSAFETGEAYDQQIAVQRVREGLHGILKKSAGFDIDKIIFIAGNDILHTDNPKRTTTSGTPQDTDGMWYENFLTAKKLMIEIIETLVSVADVEVHYNPSNHDYMSGFMLLDSISAWFRNSEQIEFFGDMSHRKYTTYGDNLIGMTHMDGAKKDDLPLLMAHEAPLHWAYCKHRYIYGHHVHHKTSKDYMSVCVETLRSPSGTDSWHHRNGYQHAPKAIEAFIHHKHHGQIARLTHLF